MYMHEAAWQHSERAACVCRLPRSSSCHCRKIDNLVIEVQQMYIRVAGLPNKYVLRTIRT